MSSFVVCRTFLCWTLKKVSWYSHQMLLVYLGVGIFIVFFLSLSWTSFFCVVLRLITSAYWIGEPHVGLLYMLGSAFQMLAIILLYVKVSRNQNSMGISSHSLAILALSHILRVSAMMGGAYIPLDALGGIVYITVQCLTTAVIIALITLCYKYRSDEVEVVPKRVGFLVRWTYSNVIRIFG